MKNNKRKNNKNNNFHEHFKQINTTQKVKKTNLNPKYTFENFIISNSNKKAFNNCLKIAKNPGKINNLLFLYGKSGIGKTHLINAIGNYIYKNSNLKVLYISVDDLVENIKNTHNHNLNLSKNKYKDVDVLIIDDIQFLGIDTDVQLKFINIFNYLYYNNKQIIISSDRSVDNLKIFDTRLKKRLNWGIKTTINIPEFDHKVKIIKNKIKSGTLMMDLSDDIINYIASNCGNDVRLLENAITRLYAYSTIMKLKEITLESALKALDGI